jgi:hypothetical protein
MNILFKWRHRDGSLVEFSKDGWKTNDAEKTKWLTQSSGLCSSSPMVSPAIRDWLSAHCQLIAFYGPEENSSRKPNCGPANRQAPKPVRNKRVGASLHHRASERVMVSKRMIDLACDNFFRSRGIPHKGSISSWRRSSQTDRN